LLLAVVLAAAIGTGIGLAIDATRGGTAKLSVSETEQWLQVRAKKGVHVKCRPGSGVWRDWDYACTISGAAVPGSAASNTYGYNVNSKDVIGFSH